MANITNIMSIVPTSGGLMISHDGTSITLSPRDALKLWQAMPTELSAMMTPELVVTDDSTTCPHCKTATEPGQGEGPVYEVDYSTRDNSTELDQYSGSDEFGLFVNQGDPDHESIVFVCTHCDTPVSVPAELDVTFS